jgi:ribokinase
MPRVAVVGSSNTDLVSMGDRLPQPGETLLHDAFLRAAGGKGANQAVAAARAGARVAFIAAVGDDEFGRSALAGLRKDRIDVRCVRVLSGVPSGIALILVDKRGENMIAVAPGANARLAPADVDRSRAAIQRADVLLASLEVPLASVARAARIAAAARRIVILNPAPAPARPLPVSLLRCVTYLTPNETELAAVLGARRAGPREARKLFALGVKAILVTRGARGVRIISQNGVMDVPAFKVRPVDTVGAGDAFNGAFAAALAEGRPLRDAVRFAQAAAAISVTIRGAQPSMPGRRAIARMMVENRS